MITLLHGFEFVFGGLLALLVFSILVALSTKLLGD